MHNFIIFDFYHEFQLTVIRVNDSHEIGITSYVCLVYYKVLFHYVNIICRNQQEDFLARTNMIRGKFNTIRRLFRATSIDRDDEAG